MLVTQLIGSLHYFTVYLQNCAIDFIFFVVCIPVASGLAVSPKLLLYRRLILTFLTRRLFRCVVDTACRSG